VKVSIITVCFNSAVTLADCLASVARQSHPDIEHIVVDGGSTDDSASIVSRFGSSVSNYINEPDDGIYDAMNKGLDASTGDLVGFLNADDLFANSECVANLVAACQEAECDAVYGDLWYVEAFDTGRIIRRWISGRFDHSKLRFGWMPPHPTFYVSRRLLQKVGRFDSTLRVAADYDFMLRSLTLTEVKVRYIPKVLVHMRAGGVSNRSISALLRKSREDLRVLRRNRVGGLVTLLFKNVRKLPQFL
jgi:glycosyltransferase